MVDCFRRRCIARGRELICLQFDASSAGITGRGDADTSASCIGSYRHMRLRTRRCILNEWDKLPTMAKDSFGQGLRRICLPLADPRSAWHNYDMTLKELEKTVSTLLPEQLSHFREWFLTFDAENWDRQFESDVASGRLDSLADDAIREHRDGKSTSLLTTSRVANSGPSTTNCHLISRDSRTRTLLYFNLIYRILHCSSRKPDGTDQFVSVCNTEHWL